MSLPQSLRADRARALGKRDGLAQVVLLLPQESHLLQRLRRLRVRWTQMLLLDGKGTLKQGFRLQIAAPLTREPPQAGKRQSYGRMLRTQRLLPDVQGTLKEGFRFCGLATITQIQSNLIGKRGQRGKCFYGPHVAQTEPCVRQ